MRLDSNGCHGLDFTVESVERKKVYGKDSYVFSGENHRGIVEVFNMGCKGFWIAETLLGRKPGTLIRRIYEPGGKLLGIKIVRLTKKSLNHQSRKTLRKRRQKGIKSYTSW